MGEEGAFKAALRILEREGISIRGPFVTRKHRNIYLIDGCILTANELIALYDSGKLESEELRKLLSDLKSLQAGEDTNDRRSERVLLKLRLLVRAEISAAKHLEEQVFTVQVSAHGGLLECPFRMTAGQRITLINPETKKEVRCHVLRVQGSTHGSFMAAFKFEQRSPWFWPVVCAPLDWAATPERV